MGVEPEPRDSPQGRRPGRRDPGSTIITSGFSAADPAGKGDVVPGRLQRRIDVRGEEDVRRDVIVRIASETETVRTPAREREMEGPTKPCECPCSCAGTWLCAGSRWH